MLLNPKLGRHGAAVTPPSWRCHLGAAMSAGQRIFWRRFE
jgi:hypothetical protein